MKILVYFLILVTPTLGLCETACKTAKWTKNRNLPLKTFKQTLDTIPRSEVIQMSWGEILTDSKNSVALPLLHYLSSTEQNSLLRGYYKSMGSMITDGLTPEDGIKEWPRRPAGRKSIYTLNNLCDLYKKSGGK